MTQRRLTTKFLTTMTIQLSTFALAALGLTFFLSVTAEPPPAPAKIEMRQATPAEQQAYDAQRLREAFAELGR